MEDRLMICITLLAAAVIALFLALLFVCCRGRKNKNELRLLQQKREAAEELNRRTAELAHHQRLQTIGTLTASVAHEFNNLLTPIMGYSMLALEKLSPEDEELYDSIAAIYESSRKAKTLVSRLSDLSRKNTDATFHTVSPDGLIQKALEVAAPAKRDNVELRLDLNCWEQRICANEIQITQLMLNLILNAFHAMEETGGTLTVSSNFDEENIRITVADTGCGIPPELRDRIFEPFFTTKSEGRGTGLGLAIAAQVAEDHHGSIKVESTPAGGTVFTVILPRV